MSPHELGVHLGSLICWGQVIFGKDLKQARAVAATSHRFVDGENGTEGDAGRPFMRSRGYGPFVGVSCAALPEL